MPEDSNSAVDTYLKPTSYGFEATVRPWDQAGKAFHAIGAEVFGYSKSIFEDSIRAFEQLLGATSPTQMIGIHAEFAQASFDTYVAQMSKLTEMVAEMWTLRETNAWMTHLT